MAIDAAETLERYEQLSHILLQTELGWVLEQVEAAIALGKPRRRHLAREEVPRPLWNAMNSDAPRKKRDSAALFTVAEEYTAFERLTMLVDATRAASVQSSDFLRAIFNSLPSDVSIEGVSFRPELDIRAGFTASRRESSDREQIADRLTVLLNEFVDGASDGAAPESSI